MIAKSTLRQFFWIILLFLLTACGNSSQTNTPDIQNTAVAIVQTAIALTQTALPTVTLSPPTFTPTALSTPLPPATATPAPPTTPTKPTIVSPYEADHEAIRKVINSYFDQIYYMHSSFQVGGLGDVISSAPDGRSFLKTKLRQLAVDVPWERLNFWRYASYEYELDYSEIVVFDAGQSARANFTERQYTGREFLIPIDSLAYGNSIEHIIMLRPEQDGWKIIYDVYNDYQPHRSLYAPTPFPQDVLNQLDKQLIDFSQGQGGPALPKAGKSFISSDPAQLERWKEYETALAEKLMPKYPRDTVSCEWELTEKLVLRINVWAVCMTSVTSAEVGNYYYPAASVPVIINLGSDGEIQGLEIPQYGHLYLSEVLRMFPNGAWKDLPNAEAMEKHLHWRMTHPSEPPLVVLNATAILTVTPVVTPTQ